MSYIKRLIEQGIRTPRPSASSPSTTSAGDGLRIEVEVNDLLIESYNKKLARLYVDHPETRKEVKELIRKELKKTRARIVKDVRNALGSDPRKAYLGVKYLLYKQFLGGNISILPRLKSGTRYQYMRPRKLDMTPNQRGGNRRPRSERTKQLETYYGRDRAFVLRFINSGTELRETRFGTRGALPMRRIFEISAMFHMETARDNVAEKVEKLLGENFEKE